MTTDQGNPTQRELRAEHLRRMLIWMSVPIAVGALLAGITYLFIYGRAGRIVCFTVAFFLAAVGGILIVRTVRQELAIRKWRGWSCPACGQSYDIHDYREATFWGSHDGNLPTAGVMLTCTHCDKITSFSNRGKALESSGGDIHTGRRT